MDPIATDPTDLEPNAPHTIDPAPSLREHAEVFGTETAPKADTSDATDEARPGETEAQAQQRRDKATGQFREGKVRHRAKSQQASADDTEAINALTGRLHAIVGEHGKDIARKEGESDRAYKLRQRVEVMERLAKPPIQAQPAPPQPQQQPVQQQVPQGYHDPEPQESDPKYESNYGLFLRDQAAWVTRDQIRQYDAYQRQQAFAQQQANSWRQRAEAAKAKYPDFEAVAFQPLPAVWFQQDAHGRPIFAVPDQFIKEHARGPELLYHLRANPSEIDALAREGPLQQAERITLLLQRTASPPPETAGTNGAASVAPVVLPPKPATPLRTEAQRPTPGPPPTDGSLGIREHAKKFKFGR